MNFTKLFDSLRDLRNQIAGTAYRREPASAISSAPAEAPKIDLSKLQLRGESYATFKGPPDLPELLTS
jgi:hypothetical protein